MKSNREKYVFEFLSVFVAVFLAFALNSWREDQRDYKAELKILTEIANGLEKDREDLQLNIKGHRQGLRACAFFQHIIAGKEEKPDSLPWHYIALTRDFITIQNASGYETLKSKGLELIKDDELRTQIISLYEYNYQTLQKMEEEYYELQFQRNYFHAINQVLAPQFRYDQNGNLAGMQQPLQLKDSDRKCLLSYLWKIKVNRRFMIPFYEQVLQKVSLLEAKIEQELQSA